MNKNLRNSLLLLQINDPFFPIGAYTHSYGLETYVQRGIVKDKNSALEYISASIRNSLLFGDVLAVKLVYEAAIKNDIEMLLMINRLLYSSKSPKETRVACEKLAVRFLKNVMALNLNYDSNIFSEYCIMLRGCECKPVFSVVYSVFCAASGIDYLPAVLNFFYGQVSGIVNNCVKLIPLSQTEGQVILRESYKDISDAMNELQSLTIHELGASSPAMELRSMQHEVLYSRLYMS